MLLLLMLYTDWHSDGFSWGLKCTVLLPATAVLARDGLRDELRDDMASWRDGLCDVLRMSGGRQPLFLAMTKPLQLQPPLLLNTISVCWLEHSLRNFSRNALRSSS